MVCKDLHPGDEFRKQGEKQIFVKIKNKPRSTAVALTEKDGITPLSYYVTCYRNEQFQITSTRNPYVKDIFRSFESFSTGTPIYDRVHHWITKIDDKCHKNAVHPGSKAIKVIDPNQPVELVKTRLSVLKINPGDIICLEDLPAGSSFKWRDILYVKIGNASDDTEKDSNPFVIKSPKCDCLNSKNGKRVLLQPGSKIEIVYLTPTADLIR
jgi:hypothetical protein